MARASRWVCWGQGIVSSRAPDSKTIDEAAMGEATYQIALSACVTRRPWLNVLQRDFCVRCKKFASRMTRGARLVAGEGLRALDPGRASGEATTQRSGSCCSTTEGQTASAGAQWTAAWTLDDSATGRGAEFEVARS